MDEYHVLELVGEGSFGRVYKGRRKCSKQVPSKILDPLRLTHKVNLLLARSQTVLCLRACKSFHGLGGYASDTE